jgi:hypothetical protein
MTSTIYHFIHFSQLPPSRRFTDVPSGGSSPGPARLSGPPLSQRPGSARLATLPARSESAVTTALVVPARKAGPGRLAGAVAAQLTGPVRLAGAGPPSPLLCSPGTFTFTRQEKAVMVHDLKSGYLLQIFLKHFLEYHQKSGFRDKRTHLQYDL